MMKKSAVAEHACMGESPHNPLGGDHSARPWQRTGVVGEGGSGQSSK